MARFFIDRPVFAWVIAILIMMAGGISIFRLPVEQYPRIAPPVVTITAKYSGASAQTLEDTVAQVIEQKLNGIDGLLYINSTSDAAGQVSIRLTFDPDTNPDVAQMQVQNKLQLATSSLPEEVTRQGITVTKVADSFLQMYAFVSSDDSMSAADLCDFVGSTILDPLSRVDGVGEVSLFGAPYAMRIWLNPSKLLSYSLTPSDVINAVKAQNKQVSLGEVGGKPIRDGQQMNVTIKAQKQLTSVPEFERILLRVNPDGSAVRLRDVARVELGQESYTSSARYNGKPAAGVGIKLASDANALNTSNAVAAFIEDMRPYFPHGVEVVSPYDTVPFIKISIIEVVKTLLEAIVLVFAVIYLFLQNFRATIIPSLAVPVVLLGTFGVMAAFGFSINTLTMFGMVLAIGLLVDDAIVVVENVARVMEEDGLPPREATIKTMGQITGALIGVAAVLSAVFVPMAFFGGTVGAIYRQFSLTIVSAMILSVVVAVVLTPVLCSTFLKPGHMASQHGFFGWFNRSFDRATTAYRGAVGRIIKVGGRMMVIYLAMLVCAGWILWRMPTSFLPNEDQGILTVEIQLGPGSTETETLKIVEQVERHFLENEKENVHGMMLTLGRASGGKGQSTARGNIRLRDWSERKDPERRAQAIIDRANQAFSSIINARVFVSAPPAIRSLGNATGFDFELQDQAGLGHEALIAARDQLMELARRSPLLRNVRTFGQDDSPQLEVDIDQEKAGAFGLPLDAINTDLSAAWGGKYVNDFVDRSRVKKVYVQADAPFRMKPEDFNRWYFRNDKGEMVPFTSIGEARWTYGPMQLERYNGVSAVRIQGRAAAGMSSGTAMLEMERLMGELPEGIGYQWTGMSFQERLSGSQAPFLYALSILVVFLCLTALYESWSIPLSVILVVPLGVLGALVATSARGLSNDVYFQIGLLATIGLAAKNAILIVEFARELFQQGASLADAAMEAARLRLRPILMTSLAFLIGVLPLAISTGAGSGSQNAIGTGVMGGTFAATVLGIFFVPVFFVLVFRLFNRKAREGRRTAVPKEKR